MHSKTTNLRQSAPKNSYKYCPILFYTRIRGQLPELSAELVWLLLSRYGKISLKIPESASWSGSPQNLIIFVASHASHPFKKFIKIRRFFFGGWGGYPTNEQTKAKHDPLTRDKKKTTPKDF